MCFIWIHQHSQKEKYIFSSDMIIISDVGWKLNYFYIYLTYLNKLLIFFFFPLTVFIYVRNSKMIKHLCPLINLNAKNDG